MSESVHPTAIVHPGANLGANVTVGPYAVIEDDVTIGDGTSIGPHAVISNGTTLGKECKIFQAAAVGGPPQDLKYAGEKTELIVGDRTVIREYVTLNRGTAESGKTVIGNDCLFMAYAHVAHDCVVGDNAILANCVALGGHVILGARAIVGGLTPVHQFCHVGENVMIGGGLRVIKDVPPYILAARMPLVFDGLNLIGLRRRGYDHATIDLIDKAYRLIYRSQLNVSQAVSRIKDELEIIPPLQTILDFIASSKRGLIPSSVH